MIPIQLRLSPDIVDRIDALIEGRVIPTSRHNWFMEAIADKIKKEAAAEG
jgi:predicted transcriptional regulator